MSKKKEPVIKPKNNVAKKPVVESTYTRDEILDNAKAFGESVEVVAGAVRLSGKDVLTKTEVKGFIQKFKTKKVR